MKKSIFLFLITFQLNLIGQNENPMVNLNDIPKIMKHSKPTKIEKIYALNSSQRETNLCLTPDGRYLYFMSDRGGQSWSIKSGTFKSKIRYDGDIWYSENINGIWQKAKCLNSTINSGTGEDEPNITPDGQKMYFQSWKNGWESSGGPYYVATKYNNVWTSPVGLGDSINKYFKDMYYPHYYYATDGMAISPNEQIFIVAAGYDYEGPMDLYISFKKGKKWTYPRLMNISTSKDERSVFIAADNKTIFFSSDAYNGFGGLDIYTCQLDKKGNCYGVKNIGEPFNTKGDDYSFKVTADGKTAYYVLDGDIYYAAFENDEFNLYPTTIVSGYIKDCNQTPLETDITLKNKYNQFILSFKSDNTGYFSFVMPDTTGIFNMFKYNDNIYTLSLSKKNITNSISTNIKYCKNQNQSNNQNNNSAAKQE